MRISITYQNINYEEQKKKLLITELINLNINKNVELK